MSTFGDMIDRRVRLTSVGDRIFRDINHPWVGFYRQLWNDGTIKDLSGRRLIVDTEPDVEGDSSTLGALRFVQPKLSFVGYPHEWSASMFKAAADVCLSIHEFLYNRDLCLIDSHPWNFVFDRTDPLWVDITSIDKYDPLVAYGSLLEFRETFLNAIALFCSGNEAIVRAVLAHRFSSMSDALRNALISGGNWRQQKWPKRILKGVFYAQIQSVKIILAEWRKFLHFRLSDFSSPKGALKVVEKMRRELTRFPVAANSYEWASYIQAGQDRLSSGELENRKLDSRRLENAKVGAIDAWFEKLKPMVRTVLDLGCNNGLFAQMAWMREFAVAGVDSDAGSVDNMYMAVRGVKASIACGVVDFVAPRECSGMVTNLLPSFVERFRADLVLCVAVTHHLFFGRYRMSFELIARLLAEYAKKFLIVEFVPGSDTFLRGHYRNSNDVEGYSIENFSKALSIYFSVVETKPSYPDGRILILLGKL